MIPLKDQEYLRVRFARELSGAVRIDYFTQRRLPIFIPGREDCAYCEDTQTLLKEIASLSEKITLNVHEFSEAANEAARLGVDKVPGTVIRGALNRPIRFFGFPIGHVLAAFVEEIVDASRGKVDLSADTTRQLRKLQQTVHLQVLVTPDCSNCPPMALLAYRLGLASAKINADVIEISEFPRLIERYDIRAVPTIVIDGQAALVGATDEATLMARIVRVVQGKALPPGPVGPATPLEQPRQEGQPRQAARTESGLFLP